MDLNGNLNEALVLVPLNKRFNWQQGNANAESVSPRSSQQVSSFLRQDDGLSFQSDFINSLPLEIFYLVLDYIPMRDVGRLGQTSKVIQEKIITWATSRPCFNRMLRPFFSIEFPLLWTGNLRTGYMPEPLQQNCRDIGVLLRRLTATYPSSQKLRLYQSIMSLLRIKLKRKMPSCPDYIIFCMMAVILHTLIAGWAPPECRKVLAAINNWIGAPPVLDSVFIHNIEDKNIEYAARKYLRIVFLDFCSPDDRITWLYIIISSIGRVVDDNLWPTLKAKVLLLLYAPIENMADGISWNFGADGDRYASFINTYKMLADALGNLSVNYRQKGRPNEAVLLLNEIENVWISSRRSMACLLLPLFSVDDSIVAAYFRHLCALGFENEATSLIIEAVAVSDQFLRRNMVDPSVNVTKKTIFKFIRFVVTNTWPDMEQRRLVNNQVWAGVQEVALDLLDEALIIGNSEDVGRFVMSWVDLCSQVPV